MDYLDKCKRELDVAVLQFADQINKHRLDDSKISNASGNISEED